MMFRWVAVLLVSACAAPPAPPELLVSARARGLHPGELVVRTLAADAPLSAVRARAFGRTLHPWAPTVTAPASPTLVFVPPVPHRANSAFGTRSVFNGEPRGAHGGADFLSPTGTPIKAPAPGTVVLAHDLYYTGGTVIPDHGVGVFSVFAHLSKISSAVGDVVPQGTVVGLVGATGRVTGAHLHWTLRVGGARVDPLAILELLGPAPPDPPVIRP